MKNSWGEENIWRIILVGYESIGNEINFVTDFQEKNWDNFYQLDREYINELEIELGQYKETRETDSVYCILYFFIKHTE